MCASHATRPPSRGYVVFKTDQWWWSIEKNDACVTIQRSKTPGYVIDKYRRQDRTTNVFGGGIQFDKKYKGSTTAWKSSLLTFISKITWIKIIRYCHQQQLQTFCWQHLSIHLNKSPLWTSQSLAFPALRHFRSLIDNLHQLILLS